MKEFIKNDIKENERGLAEKGRSAPVTLQDEGDCFIITVNEIINLCNWYLQKQIDEVELEYIANMLELSKDIKYDDNISNELFLLSSPEVNEPTSEQTIKNIIAQLQKTA